MNNNLKIDKDFGLLTHVNIKKIDKELKLNTSHYLSLISNLKSLGYPQGKILLDINEQLWLESTSISEVLQNFDFKYLQYMLTKETKEFYTYISKKLYIKSKIKNRYGVELLDETRQMHLIDVSNSNKFPLDRLKDDFNYGFMFNLGGVHWTSCYLNMIKKKIYFFDSSGNNDISIKVFVNKIKHYKINIDKTWKIYANKNVYQKDIGSCGFWSLFFLFVLSINYNNILDSNDLFSELVKIIPPNIVHFASFIGKLNQN